MASPEFSLLIPVLEHICTLSGSVKCHEQHHQMLPCLVSASQDAELVLQAAERAGIQAYTWQAFLDLGRKSPRPADPPKPEDLCTIMYTSGTTGDPKVSHPSHQQHSPG